MLVTPLICKHDLIKMQSYVNSRQFFILIYVTLMLHFRALCLFMCLLLFGHHMTCVFLWSFWILNSFTCSCLSLKFLFFREHIQVIMCLFFHCAVMSNAPPKARKPTETLICDDMLIYSLELLHWPWMGDWLCVLIQCLPEVSHPSEFYIDSAKAKNVPCLHENNSENYCRYIFHHFKFISPQLHVTETYTKACLLR